MEESNPILPVEEPVVIQPTYLFSVNTLLSEHEQLLQQEDRDRALAKTIENPNLEELGRKLKDWAIAGFPDFYPVLSYSFSLPAVCSDGVSRNITEYLAFLTGQNVGQHIGMLDAKLEGISVQCEYTSASSFNLRVTKS